MFASILSLVASARAAVAEDEPISYDGYKVFRIKTHGHTADVREQLEPLALNEWTHEIDHVDVSVSPDQLAAFEALGLDTHVMHEDLGSSIQAEAVSTSTWKRQVDDPSWFDSYHNYEDHIQYFRDLQAAYPNNSEYISSGSSYQNRSIYGLHLWGADGPGKPAILYHGTVHAREWIAAPVS